MTAPELPPLIRPSIQLFEKEWAILQNWCNGYRLAAREPLLAEIERLRADRDQCVKNMNDNAELADALRAQLEAIYAQKTVVQISKGGSVALWDYEVTKKEGLELIERPARPEKP